MSTYEYSTKNALARALLDMRVAKEDFCQREELQSIAPQRVVKSFCSRLVQKDSTVDKTRLVRRGTIANGKLDGTNLASYWNLEKSPSAGGSAV